MIALTEHQTTQNSVPMIGAAFGNTNSILPAFEVELVYWNVGIYAEVEYAFDLNDSKDNFWSYWGEMYYSPADWTWFGIVAQRIRLNETGLDVQRGIFLALQKDWFTVTGYYFNPFSEDNFWMANLGVTF